MSAFISKFWLFIQFVVIINVINYPELFRQTQFTHCWINITINFINNFPLNVALNVFKFQLYFVNSVLCWYLISLTSRLWLINIWFVYVGVKYSPFIWQLSFFLQLHPQLWSLSMLAAFVASISLKVFSI